MCCNHKNDHLLCGILCTKGLIIDGIKALLDSWRHSERNWNSSNSGLLFIVCTASIRIYVLQTIEAWFCVCQAGKGWCFEYDELPRRISWRESEKQTLLKKIIFLRNVNPPTKARIKAKHPLRDVLWPFSEKSVRGGSCTCTPAGTGLFSSARSSLTYHALPL